MSENSFQQALRRARTKSGLTQKQLSDETGIAQSTLSSWECGVNVPSPDHIFEFERVFGLGPGTLSSHLGFLPLSAPKKTDIIALIARDISLTVRDREVIITIYSLLRNQDENELES